MASLSTDKNGNRTIQVKCADGKRRSIRLGKMPKKIAMEIKTKVEALSAAAIAKVSLDRETAKWLGSIPDVLFAKLAAVGLVEPREPAEPVAEIRPAPLAAVIDEYIVGRTDLKPGTLVNLRRCRKALVDYFGADRPLTDISPGDADDFRRWLMRPKPVFDKNTGECMGEKRLHENTVRRICGRAKQLFRGAQRKRLIAESPFADMKGTNVQANKSREHFITRDVAAKVLEACPDPQWKLLFALSRYGGLRCPSEHLTLTWRDIDWDAERIVVHSPKTAHHEGKEFRVIPLFPELRPYLEAVRNEVNPGIDCSFSAPVITRYRDSNVNLRTQLLRIIKRAGVAPWPKLFQNLRASRATELAAEHAGHVAAEWLGHSTVVAQKHYWQVTESDFARALQKAVQSAAETTCNEPSVKPTPLATTADYKSVRYLTASKVTPTGAELDQQYSILRNSPKSGAISGALLNEFESIDFELAFVITAWPTLPDAVRAETLVSIRRAVGTTAI